MNQVKNSEIHNTDKHGKNKNLHTSDLSHMITQLRKRNEEVNISELELS